MGPISGSFSHALKLSLLPSFPVALIYWWIKVFSLKHFHIFPTGIIYFLLSGCISPASLYCLWRYLDFILILQLWFCLYTVPSTLKVLLFPNTGSPTRGPRPWNHITFIPSESSLRGFSTSPDFQPLDTVRFLEILPVPVYRRYHSCCFLGSYSFITPPLTQLATHRLPPRNSISPISLSSYALMTFLT